MYKVICLSVVVIVLTAMPAQAQILRRPLVQQVLHSPLTLDLLNFGISQFLPGFPGLPPLPTHASPDSSSILVDPSVKGSLARSATNLSAADDLVSELLEKYKDPPKKETVTPHSGPAAPVPVETNPLAAKVADLLKQLGSKDEKIARQARKDIQNHLQQADNMDEFQDQMRKGTDALALEKYADALAAFRKARQLNPKDDEALHQMLHASLGKKSEELAVAVDALTKSVMKLTPTPNLTRKSFKIDPKLVPIKKNDTTTFTVELDAAPDEELNLVVIGTGFGKGALSGTGKISSGQNSGMVTVTTTDLSVAEFDITIFIIPTSKTEFSSVKLKAKVSQ